MAGSHEGVYEDGVLAYCGICRSMVHMLDPEEMDWICDPCSTAGWAGTTSSWKLVPGHKVSIDGREGVVVLGPQDEDRVIAAEIVFADSPEDPERVEFVGNHRVYVHEHGAPEVAAAWAGFFDPAVQ